MNNKKGFSLVSFLLYLMLFSIITVFSCHVITSLIIPSLAATRKCQSIIALHTALDLFVREIHIMRKEAYVWKLITPHELIWSYEEHDIGWRFCDNRLERKEGIYNQSWKNATTSVVAKDIAKAIFNVKKINDRVVGIELVLTPECNMKKPVICYVATIEQEKSEE